MTRHIVALLVTLFIPATFAAAADVQASDDPLANLRMAHPRLLFTDEDLAKALADAKTDPLRAELNRCIIATAEHILDAPPVRKPDMGSSHEQDRYAVYYIVTCSTAYRLTGDERFLNRAKSDLLTVAAFPDWDPEHFLSVGEMSFAASIGYDWLYAKLTPKERALVKKALVENSLSLADGAFGYPTTRKGVWTGRARGIGNWNQVCNCGLLSAALAIADEEPELARHVIAGVRQALPEGMGAYAPDGSFLEGPGYWTYGTTYGAIAICEFHSALGTDFGLSSAPGFDRTVNYYEAVEGPFGLVFNYGDATDDLQNSPVRAWLASKFNQPFALQHTRLLLADQMQRTPVIPFDRAVQGTVANRFFALHEVWFPEELKEKAADLPLDSHIRGIADIATFRSAWNDPNALYVGFKAGTNSDHHGHLDLGSFVLDSDGQRWAIDLGPDTKAGVYVLPGYGDFKTGKRWIYFRTNNHGHNTVTPRGRFTESACNCTYYSIR
jgi:heparinase II/III-like protein